MSDAVLREAVQGLRVLVCVGPGGVGKTTVSASLALQAAIAGREAMVCTIDPARRLANALGLSAFGNVETRIPEEVCAEGGPEAGRAAARDDAGHEAELGRAHHQTASPELRERIFANRFYQALSTALAGSQEYIAMEQLWVLRSQRDYALIVLDTPPTAHALDFLEAPESGARLPGQRGRALPAQPGHARRTGGHQALQPGQQLRAQAALAHHRCGHAAGAGTVPGLALLAERGLPGAGARGEGAALRVPDRLRAGDHAGHRAAGRGHPLPRPAGAQPDEPGGGGGQSHPPAGGRGPGGAGGSAWTDRCARPWSRPSPSAVCWPGAMRRASRSSRRRSPASP